MQTKYILQKSNQRNVVDGVSECKSMSKRGVESECLKSRNLGEGGGERGAIMCLRGGALVFSHETMGILKFLVLHVPMKKVRTKSRHLKENFHLQRGGGEGGFWVVFHQK